MTAKMEAAGLLATKRGRVGRRQRNKGAAVAESFQRLRRSTSRLDSICL